MTNNEKNQTIGKIKAIAKSGVEMMLEKLAEMGEMLFIITDKKSAYNYLYHNGQQWEKRTDFDNKLCYLKRHKYIEVTSNGSQESIRFTNKGKLKILESLAAKENPGTQYHFISFDIPESLKNNRNLFRCAIKRMGFQQIQRSLWVTNKNLLDLTTAASEEYGVAEYLVNIISDHTDINSVIEDRFKSESV